jgi:hypothetical protein
MYHGRSVGRGIWDERLDVGTTEMVAAVLGGIKG